MDEPAEKLLQRHVLNERQQTNPEFVVAAHTFGLVTERGCRGNLTRGCGTTTTPVQKPALVPPWPWTRAT
jgi:hypothetical protein